MANKMGGISLGIVIDVDDPSGYKRVRVRIPELHGSMTESIYGSNKQRSKTNRISDSSIPWALVSYPFGNDFTPELNQVVSVAFINGDPDKPIVIGWIGYDYTVVEEELVPRLSNGQGA